MQEEGPGTTESEYYDRPIDPLCCDNILATIENLSVQEKVAFLGSFVRFILELAQQLNELMITVQSAPSADDGNTGMMLVQQGLQLHSKLRVTLGTVEHVLNKERIHRPQKPKLLLDHIKKHYPDKDGRVAHKPDEVAEIEAVLLVHSEEGQQICEQAVMEEDKEWARGWWSQLRLALDDHVQRPHSAVGLEDTTIDLDTPSYQDEQRTEESQHAIEEYEKDKEKEEQDILRLVVEFEREEAAKLFRQQEQKNKSRKTSRRP